jgi:folate-binding protein YgfZ
MLSTADQAHALAHAAAVRARDDLRVLRLRGEDQRSWLNGQVTADVRDLKSGVGVYALVINVKGRILSDLWVLDDGEGALALVPAATLDTVRATFDRQIIMEDVEVELDERFSVISIQGPRAAEVLGTRASFTCDELGHGGAFVLVPVAEASSALSALVHAAEQLGGGAADEAGFELARIRAGRPRLGADFGERTYPQEAGLKALAVSFNKGCYLGQEVVCTLENRGRLTRRLVRLEAHEGQVQSGDELRDAEGNAIGAVTSATRDPRTEHTLALGYAKTAHSESGTALHSDRARFVVLGFAGAD